MTYKEKIQELDFRYDNEIRKLWDIISELNAEIEIKRADILSLLIKCELEKSKLNDEYETIKKNPMIKSVSIEGGL